MIKMALSSKQEVSNFQDSTVNQAGRDLIINNHGLSADDVIAIVKSTVASELSIYTMNAESVANERLQKFSHDMVNQLAEKVADRLDRFNEPSLQFAVREAALGYVRSGSETDENNLIDLMIERVKVDEHTTKQKLIDQAIKIIPTLSPESLAVLSLLAFRQLSFSGNKQDYIKWVESVNSLVDTIAQVNDLDVEYLLQAGCTMGLSGLRAHSTWEDTCLQNMDLLLRHNPSNEAVASFLASIGMQASKGGFSVLPGISDSQKLLLVFVQTLITMPGMKVGFNVVGSRTIYDMIEKQGLERLSAPIKTLIDASVPYSKAEVVDFFAGINPNWRGVIKVFNSTRVISYQLTPVGTYIGSRQLAKLSGRKIPLEIFYK